MKSAVCLGCGKLLPPQRRKYCTDQCGDTARKRAQRAIDLDEDEPEVLEVVLTVYRFHPVATSPTIRDLFWDDAARYRSMGYGVSGRKHGPIRMREREASE